MTMLRTFGVCTLVLSWSGIALAQDPVKVDATHYKVLIDNATVRVLKIDYAPKDKSPMHQHPEAIVVPLSASKVLFGLPDGKSQEQAMESEAAMYMPAGAHRPTNIGSTRVDAILVEFKGAAPGKAILPASRPGIAMKAIAEGARATAYRATSDATFSEPAGSKHDFDQVVISLGPAPLSLSIDGKPAKTTWARGEAVFIGRGVGHETKGSGKADFIIIAIK